MLNSLVIFVVLFAVLPTSKPVPRQASASSSQTANDSQEQSQNDQSRPNPLPSSVSGVIRKGEGKPPSTQRNSGEETPENKEQKVQLTKLPPLVISKDAKGILDHIYDWGPWVFNFALVVVGFLQVFYLGRTLKQIRTQAKHMGDQTPILRDSVAAARKSADAALKQANVILEAERAWVIESVQFLDEIPYRHPPDASVMTAKVTLKNIGKQAAFLKTLHLRFHASERLADAPEFRVTQPFPEGFMLAPRERLYLRAILEEGSFDDEQVKRIRGLVHDKPLYLYIYGCIVYESMGVRGVNRFCYMWQNRMGFALSGDKPAFEKEGPTGYNQHT